MPRVPLTVEVSGPDAGPMDRCIEFSTVGQLTGELAFLTGEPRAHTLTALCHSELWVLTAEVRSVLPSFHPLPCTPSLPHQHDLASACLRLLARRPSVRQGLSLMAAKDPEAALLLHQIALRYAAHRAFHLALLGHLDSV